MAKLKENLKDPSTTRLGVGMVVIALGLIVAPGFMEVKKDFTEMWYIPAVIGGLGLLLMLSPDTIVRGANKASDRFISKDKTDA
jgi:hypothetical protein